MKVGISYPPQVWENGAVVLADLHLGDLDFNGERERIVSAVRDASHFAVEHGVGLIGAGDIADYYPCATAHTRRRDGADVAPAFRAIADAGLPIAFVPGNHDPRMSAADIHNIFALHPEEFTQEDDFFSPFPEAVICHGHKTQLFNISAIAKRFHKTLSQEFGPDWHDLPPSPSLQASVLRLLSGDIALQRQSDRIDEFYQYTTDHPTVRKLLPAFIHHLVMSTQSFKGWLSRYLTRASERLESRGTSGLLRNVLDHMAYASRLSLTHRSLRFAQAVGMPLIVSGHNHVPEIVQKTLEGKHGTSTHVYANPGSLYQTGQSDTIIHIERSVDRTLVRLMSHTRGDATDCGFTEIDRAEIPLSPELVPA